jgi:hypothetical protein
LFERGDPTFEGNTSKNVMCLRVIWRINKHINKNTLINMFKGTIIEGHTLEKMSIIKLVSASTKEGMLELDGVCLSSLWGLFSSHGY